MVLSLGQEPRRGQGVTAYVHSSIVAIIGRYNEAGLARLKDKRHDNPGLAPLLSEDEQQALLAVLQGPAEEGEVWSSKKVAAWVAKPTGKSFHVLRGYEYPERLGFSLQRPRPQYRHADLEAQEEFKKTPLQSA